MRDARNHGLGMSHDAPMRFLHHSNLLTYASLMCGLGAIASAQASRASLAGTCMAAGVIFDTFDGRFARLFVRDERLATFGVQLDSLSDAITSGLVPVLCVALLAGPSGSFAPLWWLAAFLYTMCAITRLGWYNLTELGGHGDVHDHDGHDEEGHEHEGSSRSVPGPPGGRGQRGFVGVPAPVCTLIWSSALLTVPGPGLSAVLFIVCGAAMVLPLKIPRPVGLGLAAFVLWPVTLIVVHVIGR